MPFCTARAAVRAAATSWAGGSGGQEGGTLECTACAVPGGSTAAPHPCICAGPRVHSRSLHSCICPSFLPILSLPSPPPVAYSIAEVLTTSLLQRVLVYPRAYRGVDLWRLVADAKLERLEAWMRAALDRPSGWRVGGWVAEWVIGLCPTCMLPSSMIYGT